MMHHCVLLHMDTSLCLISKANLHGCWADIAYRVILDQRKHNAPSFALSVITFLEASTPLAIGFLGTAVVPGPRALRSFD